MADATGGPQTQAASRWDMSQERAFIETLMTQRLNFLLLVVAVILGAGISADQYWQAAVILWTGTLVSAPLAAGVYRSHAKLSIILDDILFQDPEHPAAVIERLARQKRLAVGSVRRALGVWLPLGCLIATGVGAVLFTVLSITS